MGFSLGGIVGGLAGGILGGSDASSGPAGTTTKTSTQDLPEWLKPYVTSNLTGGSALRDTMTGGVNPLYGMSDEELAKTVSGYYLNPDTNPYLSRTGDIVAGKIGRAVDSRFEGAGRYGSGAHADLLATDIGNALTNLYGTNYANERGRQIATATGVPSFISGETTAKFAPYRNFASLIPNLSTTATTEPYFRNKGAGILGGALAGSQLGKMFGGGGSTSSGSELGGLSDAELADILSGGSGDGTSLSGGGSSDSTAQLIQLAQLAMMMGA